MSTAEIRVIRESSDLIQVLVVGNVALLTPLSEAHRDQA